MSRRVRKTVTDLKDGHLWSEVTRTVKPLHGRPHVILQSEIPARPVAKTAVITSPPPISMPGYSPPVQALKSGHSVIEPGLKRRLARGHLPIDATLDLHDMNQAMAQQALTRFITARQSVGDRTVLVITGKGLKKNHAGIVEQRGVLRAMLPIWLSAPHLSPLVSGLEPAARGHGGEGAFYVRLKRGRK